MQVLIRNIEAVIFCSEEAVTVEELQACLFDFSGVQYKSEEILEAVDALKEQYNSEQYSFELIHESNGFRFLTKASHHKLITSFLKEKNKKRLSHSAMETLAIIAYRQPITKGEMEQIRGVNCDYAVNKLLHKGLVTVVGKAEKIGRPLLYATSEKFMQYFGINGVNDLPQPKDFSEEENSIGEVSE